MKLNSKLSYVFTASPTPHGVGGLKYERLVELCKAVRSHPSRGGWIEIYVLYCTGRVAVVPPLTGWVD